MIVEVGNVRARVVEATPEERARLGAYLSYEAKSYVAGVWRTERRSLVTPAGTFPAGFVPLVRKKEPAVELRDDARTAEWDVARTANALAKLRPHQRAAFERAQAHRRGLFMHPTGSGKGDLLAAIVACVPVRWLVLVHRSTLLEQVRERFARYTDEEVGEVSPGRFAPARITVAMVKTVRSRMADDEVRRWLREVGGAALDEAHIAGGAEVRAVLSALTGAVYRYGFSGTPLDRSDARNFHVVGAFGPIIHRVSAAELVEAGVIAKAKVRLVRAPARASDVEGAEDWRGLYDRVVVRSAPRRELLVREVLAAPKPAFVFVTALAHGRAVEDALLAKGLQVEFVWGEKSPAQRSATLDRLRTGITQVVVTNKVFQEGVDVVGLRSVVLAMGGKSVIAVLQSLGRGSRVEAGKDSFLAIDLWDVDCGCRGRDHWGCRVLRKHAAAREETYRAQGYEVSVEGAAVAAPASEP